MLISHRTTEKHVFVHLTCIFFRSKLTTNYRMKSKPTFACHIIVRLWQLFSFRIRMHYCILHSVLFLSMAVDMKEFQFTKLMHTQIPICCFPTTWEEKSFSYFIIKCVYISIPDFQPNHTGKWTWRPKIQLRKFLSNPESHDAFE